MADDKLKSAILTKPQGNVDIAVKTVVAEKPVNKFRLKDNFENYNWTVIGLADCEWTNKAIETLKNHEEKHKLILLNEEWRRRLVVEFGTRQVPAIFRNAKYIGNYSALQAYYSGSFLDDSERFG
jgi:glutaredoxin